MKLVFLGTGSAKYKKTPEYAIPDGARRCSSLLIDGTVQIDVPIHTFDYSLKLGFNPTEVTDIFITHTHSDHYYKETLLTYAARAKQKLNLWCETGAAACLMLTDEEAQLLNIHTVEHLRTFEAVGMKVTALPANHIAGPGEQPLHYIFEKDGRKLFYGLDGGWLRSEEWGHLYKNSIKLDCAVFDTTVGEQPGNFRIGTHNTIPMLRLLVAAFKENGIVKEDGKLIASHIGPHIHGVSAEETEKILAEFGVIIARDGFEIEI